MDAPIHNPICRVVFKNEKTAKDYGFAIRKLFPVFKIETVTNEKDEVLRTEFLIPNIRGDFKWVNATEVRYYTEAQSGQKKGIKRAGKDN